MSKKNKIIITIGAFVVFVGFWLSPSLNLGSVVSSGAPSFKVASSTEYTLAQTSLRILATSTPTKRLAVTVQPINCTAGGPVFLNTKVGDAVATVNTGLAVFASSTQSFSDYPNVPVVQNSVQAVTGSGSCRVLVTEWRSQH